MSAVQVENGAADACGGDGLGSLSLERLEGEICELAGHIWAATCRWLCLVAEFERREGWKESGCVSCAQWLSWRCGLAPGAAREQLRVARRLCELPRIREAFSRGELSYSKVRALSRVASAKTELDLLMLAHHATAAQLERLVRSYRGIVVAEVARHNRSYRERELVWFWDEDGSLVIHGRLPAEDGALLLRALEAGRDELRAADRAAPAEAHEPEAAAQGPAVGTGAARSGVSAETPSDRGTVAVTDDVAAEPPASSEGLSDTGDPSTDAPGDSVGLVTAEHVSAETPADRADAGDRRHVSVDMPADRIAGATAEHAAAETPVATAPELAGEPDLAAERPGAASADALVLMAETLLASGARTRAGAERSQVVVHVDAAALADGAPDGRCELEDGPALPAETARRLACDTDLVTIIERQGRPLSVGRKMRAIPAPLRRALRSRDGGCQFPGCDRRRFVDAHHLEHWAIGGETKLSNLVLLCRHHHRLLHEHGYRAERSGTRILFRRPDGEALPRLPAAGSGDRRELIAGNHRLGLRIGPDTPLARSGGERTDHDIAVAGLLFLEGLVDPSDFTATPPWEVSEVSG